MIPLSETPIYDQLHAEYDMQERINQFFTNTPLLHNGKKP